MRAGWNTIANNYASKFVSIHERDRWFRFVPSFCLGRPREVASGNKYPLSGRTQSPSKIIDFRATDRVPPPLYLRLNVSSGKELVPIFHIRVHVDSTIPGYSSDGNLDESTAFEYELYEMLEVVRSELEQARSHGLYFHRRCSFSFSTAFRERRDLALQVP